MLNEGEPIEAEPDDIFIPQHEVILQGLIPRMRLQKTEIIFLFLLFIRIF